jgi:hypothetical protein
MNSSLHISNKKSNLLVFHSSIKFWSCLKRCVFVILLFCLYVCIDADISMKN